MINENKLIGWTNRFFWKYQLWVMFFLYETPNEKYQKLINVKIIILMDIQNIFDETMVYLRDLICKPKYWELSWAIIMEFYNFEKGNNSIVTKLCGNFLSNYKKRLNNL